FLASQYERLSAKVLRPVVRDNLTCSHAWVRYGTGRSRTYEDDRSKRPKRLDLWLYIIVAVMFFIFAVRLVEFERFLRLAAGVSINLSYNAFDNVVEQGPGVVSWGFDWHYLFISIPQFLWAVYVIEIVRKIFSRVDENRFMRLHSYFLVLLVFVGMVWTALEPRFWLLWIGVNGVFVGTKFGHLGRMVRKQAIVENRLGVIGFWSIGESIVVVWLGLWLYPNVSWDLPSVVDMSVLTGLFIQLFNMSLQCDYLRIFYAAVPLTGFFCYMYKWHATKDSAVEFTGLYRRLDHFRAPQE
ncbi:MAG: hypothetical protein JSW34_04630, partial [Candidatus Zixiibacteriota bacterium]